MSINIIITIISIGISINIKIIIDININMVIINTIVAVRLKSEPEGPYLTTGELKKVYALMTADISEFLSPESTLAERRVASQRCLTGQPVDIPGGSVLRTVLGAEQLKDLVTGKQGLDSMIEDDRVLLAKLALIARQYDYLLSHSL